MAVAFSSGGYPQPPAKKCERTFVSSELSDAHPTTEEAQPSAVADLIIPPELVPIKKALTATIEASGNLDEHEFKVAIAYTTYAEWRCTKSLPELTQMQQRHMCIVFQGFLAMYHPEVRVPWFHEGKINAAKAEEFYMAYCDFAVPLTQLQNCKWAKPHNAKSEYAMRHLAWAIRKQQHSGEGHFLPHAQRYLEELNALFCDLENNDACERRVKKTALSSMLADPELLPMAAALPSGGVPQPPARKCKLTRVSSKWRDVHPTTEEAQPSSVADLIIPPELVPIKTALTASIEAFDSYGKFDDEEFKAATAYCTYAEWRRTKSLPELPKVQRGRVYNVLQGFLAMYHEEVPVAWFRNGNINAARAEKLYAAYCRNAIRLGQLRRVDLVHLAWAIREQQQSGEGHFLPHAQRCLEELKDLLCTAPLPIE